MFHEGYFIISIIFSISISPSYLIPQSFHVALRHSELESQKGGFYGRKVFTAPQPPPTDSGTTTITAVESLVTSTGVNVDTTKIVGLYLNKVRDRLVIVGTDKSATPIVEIGKALDAFKAHAPMLQSKMKASGMEERMLALGKAVMKNLEEPSRKTAAFAIQEMGRRLTYASILAPPVSKAAVRIRVQGANKMEPAEPLEKAEKNGGGILSKEAAE